MTKKITVPIVFSFNHWILIEAGVCINSLLRFANSSTFYEIYILHGADDLNEDQMAVILRLKEKHTNCNISFLNIGDVFNNVFIARGIPKVTYYRLLIPNLLPQYDKIIFSDPDIIFRGDLSDIFLNTDLNDYYLAAVKETILKNKYIYSIGCDPKAYTSGGFQIYNLKAFREFGLVNKQLEMCGGNFFYLDQDITNIVCKGKIKFISPKYNSTQAFYSLVNSSKEFLETLFTAEEILEGAQPVVIHYNGINPWQGLCYRQDIWWEEYRLSIYFEEDYYYKYYEKILDLPWKVLLKKLPKALVSKKYRKIYRKFFPW